MASAFMTDAVRRWTWKPGQGMANQATALALVLISAVLACSQIQAQTFTSLYVFTGGTDGAHPRFGSLIRDTQGNLYGTTEEGGADGYGTIFQMDVNGTETVLYSFKGGNGDGAFPFAGLVQDGQGNFFGTTLEGGSHGFGTVFKLDAAGVESVLYSFAGGGVDGAYPGAGLLRDAAGNLYGTTSEGGPYNGGTVFTLDVTGKESVLYSFTAAADGGFPGYGALLRDGAGNLYGTTTEGGAFGQGTVFKLNSAGREFVLHSFTGGADGGHPLAGLTANAKGNTIYGTTWLGGAFGQGTVFKLSKSGIGAILYNFTGGADGSGPAAGVIQDAKGNLYGTTGGGGALGFGTVFELSSAGKESVLYSFMLGSDGGLPCSGLLEDSAGNFYGTTPNGGGGLQSYNFGTVFKLSP